MHIESIAAISAAALAHNLGEMTSLLAHSKHLMLSILQSPSAKPVSRNPLAAIKYSTVTKPTIGCVSSAKIKEGKMDYTFLPAPLNFSMNCVIPSK